MRKTVFAVSALAVFALSSIFWVHTVSASTCRVGTKTQVKWKGAWYKSTVLRVKSRKVLISYDGYGSNWNEWVAQGRIKCRIVKPVVNPYPKGSSVSVKWKSKWWPAKVIGVRKNAWKIHYNGYDNSWNEWVGPSRIKK